MAEPWMSADEIATHLGVFKDTMYAWIAEKSMPAQRVGKLWSPRHMKSMDGCEAHRPVMVGKE